MSDLVTLRYKLNYPLIIRDHTGSAMKLAHPGQTITVTAEHAVQLGDEHFEAVSTEGGDHAEEVKTEEVTPAEGETNTETPAASGEGDDSPAEDEQVNLLMADLAQSDVDENFVNNMVQKYGKEVVLRAAQLEDTPELKAADVVAALQALKPSAE